MNAKRNDPLQTIKKLIQERYSNAKAVFWAGSVSQNQGTDSSDLDLVIIFETLPNAYREAYFYEGWPIDAFVHDKDTLHYFFEESRIGNGISGTITMVLKGIEITAPTDFSEDIKMLAKQFLKEGPLTWSSERIIKERFLITDILDDIRFPKNREEQIACAIHLFEPLIQFYFRANQKWTASGKSLARLFKNDNPLLAAEVNRSFEDFFQTGDVSGIENVVNKILAPFGGLLWDGFESHAPAEFKIIKEHR